MKHKQQQQKPIKIAYECSQPNQAPEMARLGPEP